MKILLVDDERDEREGISFLIHKYQYPLEILQATCGREALDILASEKIDILFTDVKMPGMSGLELAKIVREKDQNIRIIIFSAYAEFEYAKQAVEMHALRYLLKPIEVSEFRDLMENVMLSLEESDHQKEMKRQDMLYDIFSGKQVHDENEKREMQELFSENSVARFVNLEFDHNFFEEHDEQFRLSAVKHLGDEIDCVELFPNEACVLIRSQEFCRSRTFPERIQKFVNALSQNRDDAFILFASPIIRSVDSITEQVKKIADVKRDIFGYGNQIVYMDQYLDKAEHYVQEIEFTRRQLITALDSQNPNIIRKENQKFIQTIWKTGSVSRLYVQNLLYTVLKAIYDKVPGMETEEVLEAAESLFHARKAGQIIEAYEQIIDKMLSGMQFEQNDSEIILKIKAIVERDYHKELGLDEVARQVHMAPAYVSYIFKQETGQTLVKYITDVKMEKARKYLENMDMKIVQVGRACGYENQSYFNRLFKNYYGLTPKQFRERL
ncbi:MAG: response regulator [Bilifractor sp.]